MIKFENRNDDFFGFFDMQVDAKLAFDVLYDFEVVRAELVGSNAHLLMQVFICNVEYRQAIVEQRERVLIAGQAVRTDDLKQKSITLSI